MQSILQDALDEIGSYHSSLSQRSQALHVVEEQLAHACVGSSSFLTRGSDLDTFLTLQDTFTCNIPLRLLSWMSTLTPQLEIFASKGSAINVEKKKEAFNLTAQVAQALTIIQGVALHHKQSKEFLGRRYALEILIDLLLVSRHLPLQYPPSEGNIFSNASMPTPSVVSTPHLSSIILDTFLCILVDSSPALRVFEKSTGVQAVVKILKRAGTPRDVRMKCLEFLYFYLLDEDPSAGKKPHWHESASAASSMLDSSSLLRSPESFVEQRVASSDSSESSSFTSSSLFSFVPSVSTSSSPEQSRLPTENTTVNVTLSSPEKLSASSSFAVDDLASSHSTPHTPPIARPTNQNRKLSSAISLHHSRSSSMPRMDPAPMSRHQHQIAKLGLGPRHPLSPILKSRPILTLSNADDMTSHKKSSQSVSIIRSGSDISPSPSLYDDANVDTPLSSHTSGEEPRLQENIGLNDRARGSMSSSRNIIRTPEEKRKILGTMLGNVEAIVESVRKAGIWGLT